MRSSIDLLESALQNIANDGQKMLLDEFMMRIFKSILDILPDFKFHMTFMFKQKQTPAMVTNQSNLTEYNNSKVLP